MIRPEHREGDRAHLTILGGGELTQVGTVVQSGAVTFHGYLLPKGTAVYANVSWIMNDPAHWDQPQDFNPDRFLDAETGAFRRQERCIPFLIGKRYCLGQQLAHHQLFLFLTGLLQHFTFSTPLPSPELVNIEPIVGFLHQCPAYEVILTRRQL